MRCANCNHKRKRHWDVEGVCTIDECMCSQYRRKENTITSNQAALALQNEITRLQAMAYDATQARNYTLVSLIYIETQTMNRALTIVKNYTEQ
jgi:hypothetical protein